MSSGINMIINKPKKSDQNSYTCVISTKQKKTFSILLNKCNLVSLKDQYLYLKTSNSDLDTFFDINATIIDIVKENCGEWFNNNMNMDLVEEYFINTLVYDKNQGDLIKIKLISDCKEVLDVNINYSLKLSLKHLRFYKQKFVIEFNIKDVEVLGSIEPVEACD